MRVKVLVSIWVFALASFGSHFESIASDEAMKLSCAYVGSSLPLDRLEFDRRTPELLRVSGMDSTRTVLLNSERVPEFEGLPSSCETRQTFTPAFGTNPDTYRITVRCPAPGHFVALTVLEGASRKGHLMFRKENAGQVIRTQFLLADCKAVD